MRPRFLFHCLGCSLLWLAGCRDREITSYRTPKEAKPATTSAGQLPADHPPLGSPVAAAGGNEMANTAVPTADGSKLSWTAPARWTAKPLGAMRKGSFALKSADGAEADLSITAFPGDTGGLEANLNRWRGQVALPSLAAENVSAALEHLDANGLHFDLVEFTGTANGASTTILGAILSRPGETWFFKLMGPTPLVSAEKPAFRQFIQSVQEAR